MDMVNTRQLVVVNNIGDPRPTGPCKLKASYIKQAIGRKQPDIVGVILDQLTNPKARQGGVGFFFTDSPGVVVVF